MKTQFNITKTFNFCYGHRVHNQTLDATYTIDTKCACRALHGHNGDVTISLLSETLKNGMVIDFKYLNWFKKWLDDTLDHKFIMDLNDPLLPFEVPLICNTDGVIEEFALQTDALTSCYRVSDSYMKMLDFTPLQEKYEGMVFVPFVPTSENLARWLFDIVQVKMKPFSNVIVEYVTLNETPKSSATFSYE